VKFTYSAGAKAVYQQPYRHVPCTRLAGLRIQNYGSITMVRLLYSWIVLFERHVRCVSLKVVLASASPVQLGVGMLEDASHLQDTHKKHLPVGTPHVHSNKHGEQGTVPVQLGGGTLEDASLLQDTHTHTHKKHLPVGTPHVHSNKHGEQGTVPVQLGVGTLEDASHLQDTHK